MGDFAKNLKPAYLSGNQHSPALSNLIGTIMFMVVKQAFCSMLRSLWARKKMMDYVQRMMSLGWHLTLLNLSTRDYDNQACLNALLVQEDVVQPLVSTLIQHGVCSVDHRHACSDAFPWHVLSTRRHSMAAQVDLVYVSELSPVSVHCPDLESVRLPWQGRHVSNLRGFHVLSADNCVLVWCDPRMWQVMLIPLFSFSMGSCEASAL